MMHAFYIKCAGFGWVAPKYAGIIQYTHHLPSAEKFDAAEAESVALYCERTTSRYHDVWNESALDDLIFIEGENEDEGI